MYTRKEKLLKLLALTLIKSRDDLEPGRMMVFSLEILVIHIQV